MKKLSNLEDKFFNQQIVGKACNTHSGQEIFSHPLRVWSSAYNETGQ